MTTTPASDFHANDTVEAVVLETIAKAQPILHHISLGNLEAAEPIANELRARFEQLDPNDLYGVTINLAYLAVQQAQMLGTL